MVVSFAITREVPVTSTISRFEAALAPCGQQRDGERFVTEDHAGTDHRGLCATTAGAGADQEEYHDGSVHLMVVNHHGKVLVDEELRGE